MIRPKQQPGFMNPTIREGVLQAVRNGAPLAAAARAVGIHPDTIQRWKQRANRTRLSRKGGHPDPDGIYQEFFDEVAQAEAAMVTEALADIRKAGENPKAWAARAWVLERRLPGIFGQKVQIEAEVRHEKVYNFREPEIPEPVETEARVIHHAEGDARAPLRAEGEGEGRQGEPVRRLPEGDRPELRDRKALEGPSAEEEDPPFGEGLR